MKGELVIIRTLGDRPKINKVWQVEDDIVFACNESRFDELESGSADFPPIGFPIEDVYFYDEVLYNEVKQNNEMWEKLSHWYETSSLATE